jgi:hypothetical protein
MRFLLLWATPLALATLTGCNGNVIRTSSAGGSASTTTSNGTGSTTGSQSTSTGTGGPHGCQSAADCGGKTCAPLTPGGYQVCLTAPPEATMCQGMMGVDQCCTSADCATKGGGSCYASMNLQFCGGAQLQANLCVADGCTTDADCVKNAGPAICAPAGAFNSPKRVCLAAYCKTDLDCTAKPGGACLLVGNNDCCKYASPDGLACVYAGDCVKNTDCPMGDACHIDMTTGRSACKQGIGACPG